MTRAHPPYLSANDRRDSASRDWLHDARYYRSTDFEWFGSGILLGVMLLAVAGWPWRML